MTIEETIMELSGIRKKLHDDIMAHKMSSRPESRGQLDELVGNYMKIIEKQGELKKKLMMDQMPIGKEPF